MKVMLSINAGSSSLKVSVFAAQKACQPLHIADAQLSGLTAPPCRLKYSRSGQQPVDKSASHVQSLQDAFELVLETLIDHGDLEQIASKQDIAITCHRIVHGGNYDQSHIITKDTYHDLEQLSDLAPLHNGPALTIVDSCIQQLPHATNVACFDSQFHATIPPHISTYPIDQQVAQKNALRKYGFHGISYSFITRSVAHFLAKPVDQLNLIALHLGSGASACAIKAGKSWDTSMGLTPLAGLPGATRSGSVDPSLVFHYASHVGRLSPASTKHLHISKAEEILNKQSGWKSLTGTADFEAIASSDQAQHVLAFDLLVDRICGFVGSYYVSLRGNVDALVFAGGIGEKSPRLRRAVVEAVACLGWTLDDHRNASTCQSPVWDVGARDAKQRILVCQTDEQLEMALKCCSKEELWL
ncbi:hypothetical protein CDD81_2595 [Ophiocordyceps australis]|uniref:Probable acetate kinase n=1 Tax=Ophiocordyceps australis TaxID=1399860 RepID=A0A2C5XTH9_9HYPO|nr:hypothetical protein CDD81_2595 [Ophiocordyceps australis]